MKYVPLATIATIVVFMATFIACAPAAPATAQTVSMKQLASGIYYIDPEPGVRCYARYSDTFSCVKQ